MKAKDCTPVDLSADVLEIFDLGLWIGWMIRHLSRKHQNSFMPLSTVWGLGLRKLARLDPWAISGFTALRVDGKPEMVNSLVCDKITSLTAAEAIVAALFRAERSGQGQRVEISMLDAALSFLWPDTMNNFTFLDEGVETVAPLDHSVFLHETKDGWIASMPVQEAEFFGIFRALDLPGMIEDPRFVDAAARLEHRDELRELMDAAYPRFTTQQLCMRFEEEDVPYSHINTRADVPEDPQVKAMGALLTYQHPYAGLVRTPRPAAQFEQTPSNLYAHTPANIPERCCSGKRTLIVC